MGLARTLSVALAGVSGRLVEVETDLSAGLPGLTFTGLHRFSVLTAQERFDVRPGTGAVNSRCLQGRAG